MLKMSVLAVLFAAAGAGQAGPPARPAPATGRIVIWVPAKSPLAIEQDGVRALAGASRIALANPLHAPYGKAAEAALRQAGLWDRMKGRLVLGENVAQAAQFVQSGAAAAGI